MNKSTIYLYETILRFIKDHPVGMFVFAIVTGVIGNFAYDFIKSERSPVAQASSNALTDVSTPYTLIPVPTLSAIRQNLFSEVALADQLYGSNPRNRAYVKIIDRALVFGELEVALQIVEKLYGSDIRNDNFDKLINRAIAVNNLDFAEQIVNRLYGSTRRNDALQRLLEARAKPKD